MADKLKVTLVKSPIGCVPKHRRTVEALGLKKVNKTVELPDNAAVRGMVNQVSYLLPDRQPWGCVKHEPGCRWLSPLATASSC